MGKTEMKKKGNEKKEMQRKEMQKKEMKKKEMKTERKGKKRERGFLCPGGGVDIVYWWIQFTGGYSLLVDIVYWWYVLYWLEIDGVGK